uniref:C2H2-type domain-containing protein n=1 Tax=Strongyloides papillosus TaxID=174720 RepID=A0A0N5CDW5_STREA
MEYVFCPACFNLQDPNNSRKLLLSSLMSHFQNYHGWKSTDCIKFRCVETECRDLTRNEYRLANTFSIKKGLMQLKSYYNHCKMKHNRCINYEEATNTSAQSINLEFNNESNNETTNEIFMDFNDQNYENFEIEESLYDSGSDDNDESPFDSFQERNPRNVDEWKKYLMEIIFDYFKDSPGTEVYFKDIILLLKRVFFPLKDGSVMNTKAALLAIDFKKIIKNGKEMVETIKITDPNETVINNDETEENDIVKRDKQLFYYIPFEKSIPPLIKKLQVPQTDSILIILYADDIQSNNSLGSHTKTGSFLHIAFKLHIPGNCEIAKQCSKLENIATLGVVLTEVTKFSKFDWLIKHVKNMISNLEIIHLGKKVKFNIFCFCGDHMLLQDVFNLPKSFKGEGGPSCRTCLIYGRDFKKVKSCYEANKDEVLRKENFSSSLEYPLNEYSDVFHDILEGVLGNVIYAVVQKLTYYDSQYRPLPQVLMNWNLVELEIRKYNKNHHGQNISSILKDNFFSKYTSRDNVEKKNKYSLSGAEQLAVGKALLHCMNSEDTASLFKNTVDEVFYSSKKLLNDILQIYYITSSKKELSNSDISTLEYLIDRFMTNYFNYVVDESKCSMKFHVLRHYPLYARRYRNFVAVSCIRFEAKNKTIKVLHSISNNKKNPSYTIMGKLGLRYLINNETNS